jgi:tRNA dimethylallyltransferase
MMMQQGLLEEVKSLQNFQHLNALKTVGYSEIFQYLNRQFTLEEAVEKLKQNTRNFAKRQLTWFKKNEGVVWFEPENEREIFNLINDSLRELSPRKS